MINIEKLNELQKKDYIALESQCINMRENGSSYYDVMCMLNDLIYSYSETVSNEYINCLYSLEEYYHKRWIERELN